jgi:hypothetical protein
MFAHHLRQCCDLLVEGGDDCDLCFDDGRIGALERRRLA